MESGPVDHHVDRPHDAEGDERPPAERLRAPRERSDDQVGVEGHGTEPGGGGDGEQAGEQPCHLGLEGRVTLAGQEGEGGVVASKQQAGGLRR